MRTCLQHPDTDMCAGFLGMVAYFEQHTNKAGCGKTDLIHLVPIWKILHEKNLVKKKTKVKYQYLLTEFKYSA